MTHECLRCGEAEFNNVSRAWCPKCGELMYSTFDEDQHWEDATLDSDGDWWEDDDPEEQA